MMASIRACDGRSGSSFHALTAGSFSSTIAGATTATKVEEECKEGKGSNEEEKTDWYANLFTKIFRFA